MNLNAAAQAAYEVYGNKANVSGQALPPWDRLPGATQEAWEAAALAVNPLLGVTLLEKPLENWQIRELVDAEGTLTVVIVLDMDEVLDGIEHVSEITCELIAGKAGPLIGDIAYELVGVRDGSAVVQVIADCSVWLPEPGALDQQCQNCERRFAEDELINPIPDLCQRVAPGEPMPSGECPACGAVCHPMPPPPPRKPYKLRVIGQYHCSANRIPTDHLQMDGFFDLENMLTGMRDFYPEFSEETACTVVLFERLQDTSGKL